jgi:hypothetical protein
VGQLGRKTTSEVVEFYYTTWKGSDHYERWKNGGLSPPPRPFLPSLAAEPRVVVLSDDDESVLTASRASPPPLSPSTSSPSPPSPLPTQPSSSTLSLTAIVETFPQLLEAEAGSAVPSQGTPLVAQLVEEAAERSIRKKAELESSTEKPRDAMQQPLDWMEVTVISDEEVDEQPAVDG